MTTTIRGLFRPALQLLTLAMVAALLTLTGMTPAQPGEQSRATVTVKETPIKLATAARLSRGERVVRTAAAQAGDPYRYGATGPNAFDCSGLTSYAYRVGAHKKIPRTSGAQRTATKRIPARSARRGDLVFFHRGGHVFHVAIYAGSHTIWTAPYTGARVRKERIWSSAVSYGRVR